MTLHSSCHLDFFYDPIPNVTGSNFNIELNHLTKECLFHLRMKTSLEKESLIDSSGGKNTPTFKIKGFQLDLSIDFDFDFFE